MDPATTPERGPALEAVFQPVQPPTTFEETVERLGTAIRLGLLVPGTRLPSERDLADQLKISRSTLRQALTTLVQSGHLVSQRGPRRRHLRGRRSAAGPERDGGRALGDGPGRCSTTGWRWRPGRRLAAERAT